MTEDEKGVYTAIEQATVLHFKSLLKAQSGHAAHPMNVRFWG